MTDVPLPPGPPAPTPSPAPAPAMPTPTPAVPDTADPGVAVAFALGWQVAELYLDPHHQQPDTRPLPDDLPGIGRLTESQRTDLGLRQIEAGLHRLLPRMETAGLTPPDTSALREAFESSPDAGGDQPASLRAHVLALHTATLQTLTAADFRLGKAYGLGRAMADTAEVTDAASLSRRFDFWRIRQLDIWLADLDSALPAHASSSVRMSVARWTRWARKPSLGSQPFEWERDIAILRRALHRQAQRWRALLSGEKAGVDMLRTKDYLAAAREMLSRAGELLWGVLKHLWFVVVAVAVLIAAGVILLVTSDTASSNIAAIVALAAAIGVTWQGVGTALWGAAQRLEKPLWGAALNLAIFEAITELPRQSARDARGMQPLNAQADATETRAADNHEKAD